MTRRRMAAIVALALAGAAAPARARADDAAASTSIAIEGDLRRAGDRTPLVGVAVLVYPAAAEARLGEVRGPAPPEGEPAWLRRALTDERGAFTIEGVPAGRVAVEVVTAGYLRARWIVDVPGRGRRLRLFLRPEDRAIYRTTVNERRRSITPEPAPAPARRVLEREEIRTLPGSQGDPLRALQSLPGVARAPFGAGLLVLRGAGPRLSQVYVGDHPVPLAFHLSGLATIVSGDVLGDLEFTPSNFSPAYGNASGGLIAMTPRRGRRDGYHGNAFLDLGGVGAVAEGPAGAGSFLVAARRAHLDLPLRAAASFQPHGFSAFPTYHDVQVFYDRPLRRRQHLHIGFLGAGDRLAYRTPEDAEGRRLSIFETRTSFYRVDLAYRGRVGATSFLLTPALRFDTNRIIVETMEFDVPPRRSYVTTLRAQIDHRLTDRLSVVVGADADLGVQSGETEMRPYYGSNTTSNSTTLSHDYLGLYGEAVYRGPRLTIAAGSRLAAFLAEGQRGFAADPRLRARAELGERWSLSAAVGLYSQPWIGQYRELGLSQIGTPDVFTGGHLILPDQIRDNFDPTVPTAELGLRVVRALHASAGVALRLDHEIDVEATGFVRDLRDPSRSPDATYGDREAPVADLAYGGELLLRKRLVRRLYGWIAYTLLWARSEAIAGPPRAFTVGPYDQRHNLVAVLSLRLPREWQIGARFRLASGLPYTPIYGATGIGTSYQAIAGPPLSDRFPVFHQLDVRIDKRWILRRVMVAAYLDILNAYNYANTEAYVYTVDYRRRLGGLATPILPLFGVRVDL